MVQLLNFSCTSKRELELKEREFMEAQKPTLNKYIPTRTRAEYDADNRERLLQEKRVSDSKRYQRKVVCQCGLEVAEIRFKVHQKTRSHLKKLSK